MNYFLEAHEPFTNIIKQLDGTFADIISGNFINLNNTAVFIVSDHGQHASLQYALMLFACSYCSAHLKLISFHSESAEMENKLPVLVSLLPKKFLDKYPEYRSNLKANEQSLVTGRDLNAWWTHLVTGKTDTDYANPSGISLMAQIIPDRNCNDAKIDHKMCICNMHNGTYHSNMNALQNKQNYQYSDCLIDGW